MLLRRNLWLYEMPRDGGGAPPVPGTGEAGPGSSQQTSPGTQPVVETEPPGPIPYSRFKEVNDARRQLEERMQPYVTLEDLGYNADELQRLTQWEQEYSQDPVGTWLRQAEQIDALPDEVKAAVTAVRQSTVGGLPKGNPPADGGPPLGDEGSESDEPPDWFKPYAEDYQARRQEQESKAVSEFYDGLQNAWKEIDTQQGVKTPEAVIHAFMAAHSPSAASAEELLRTARESWLAVREEVLKAEINPPGRTGTVPYPVPSSGGEGGSTPPLRPRTLQEAKKLAEAAAERGLLTRQT